jgi:hypothetical protein
MTVTVLSIHDIPGPAFRRMLRQAMAAEQPWTVIIDTRPEPLPSLDRIAMMLRLTHRARKTRADVVLVVDHATRQRLGEGGIDRGLSLAGTVEEAQGRLRSAGDRVGVASKAPPRHEYGSQ